MDKKDAECPPPSPCRVKDRQLCSSHIPSENGRHKKPAFVRNFTKDMGISASPRGVLNRQLDPFRTKCRGGQRVETEPKLQRMGPESRGFSSSMPEMGPSRDRCFRLEDHAPTSILLESGPGSGEPSKGCDASVVDRCFPLPLPSLLPPRKGLGKSEVPRVSESYLNSPSLARTTVVSNAAASADSSSDSSSPRGEPAGGNKRGTSSPRKLVNPRSLPGYRASRKSQGLSDRVISILVNAKRPGTIRNYSSTWTKWSVWCSGREANPFNTSLRNVTDFLADLFDQGLSARYIGVFRSSISTHHLSDRGL